MTDGLIATFEGRIIICLIFMGLGFLASIIAMIGVMIRYAPPLTTQTNRETGVVTHGLSVWIRVVAAVTMGLPALALIIVTGFELTAWLAGHMHVLPIGGFVGGLAVVAVAAARRSRKARVEAPVAVEVPPVAQGWSMPTDAQWDR